MKYQTQEEFRLYAVDRQLKAIDGLYKGKLHDHIWCDEEWITGNYICSQATS